MRSLPPYFGGKRRLLGAIFRSLPPASESAVFLDPFLGGGSVALYAKARGHRVVCNDLAERSVIVGKALIENSTAKLSYEDVVRLFVHQDGRHFAQEQLAPDVFPIEHARFMDTALGNADRLSGPKRWLARLLVVKYALRMRPMGNFGAKAIVRQATAGAWEDMNPHYVKDLVGRGVSTHPLRVVEQLRKQINGGVFSNGHENEAHQGNAIEFLERAQSDIVYLDPPYAGTQSYERALRPLDELLAGECVIPDANPFSTDDPVKALTPLLEASAHIPTLVLSYGNARIDLPGLMDLVRRHRPKVEGRSIRYTHCTGLASEESRQRNQELLVIGRSR